MIVPLSMTKNDELLVLEDAINKLGRDSYLGPWLKEIKAELTRDIENDFFPCITLESSVSLANKAAEDIIHSAKIEAGGIVRSARSEADRIKVNAYRVNDSVRQLISKIEDLGNQL